jgi:hypothetical protein
MDFKDYTNAALLEIFSDSIIHFEYREFQADIKAELEKRLAHCTEEGTKTRQDFQNSLHV